jgi:cytochrome c oxidase assembly factor CtaG
MNPTWKDLVSLWAFWPQIILLLLALAILYARGWWQLRQRGKQRLASGWRLASFLSGLVILGLAMLSFIEVLYNLLFSLHMVQHLLITMIGPPLLLLADPYPFLIWGLPENARLATGRFLAPGSATRRVLRYASNPWLIWALYVGGLWLWHLPAAYDAALTYEVLHILEHLTFFVPAMLFWWHVTGAAPRLHGRLSYGFRIGYLLAALAQNEILGIIIAFSREPLYPHYTTVPRLWGLSVLDDQMLGGALMWVPGGMMYALAAIVLIARYLEQEETKTRQQIDRQLRAS